MKELKATFGILRLINNPAGDCCLSFKIEKTGEQGFAMISRPLAVFVEEVLDHINRHQVSPLDLLLNLSTN